MSGIHSYPAMSDNAQARQQKRQIQATTLLNRNYQECISSLTWSLQKAKKFAEIFDRDIQEAIELRGQGVLFNHEQNSLKAVDTFVDLVPTGHETGNYYAIDMGGTNLRVVCVMLQGNGTDCSVHRRMKMRNTGVSEQTPKGLLDANTPAEVMFDHIARLTKELMIEVNDDPVDEHHVAFTFSFPLDQKGIADGELIVWTKEFETGCNTDDPVEGQNVAKLMNAAFKRNGMGCIVGCLANDTVGTLLGGAYNCNINEAATRVGVIAGTGFNVAAYDAATEQHGYIGSIVNYECCNYNGVAPYQSIIDIELDYSTTSRGYQLAEKMIGAYYIGEICRLAIVKVFQHRCPPQIYQAWTFNAADVAAIYGDNTKRYKITQLVLKGVYNWVMTDEVHLRIIYKIVCAVFDRSATVAALMTAVISKRTRYLQKGLGGVSVAVDGSLYSRNAKYRITFRKTVEKLLGSLADNLHLFGTSDGSGKGAAVIAACQVHDQAV